VDLRLESSPRLNFAANTKGDAGLPTACDSQLGIFRRRVNDAGWADGYPWGLHGLRFDAGGVTTAVALGDSRIASVLNHPRYRDGISMQDMNQGILSRTERGIIIAYDFGIMGHIDDTPLAFMPRSCLALSAKITTPAEVHSKRLCAADKDVDEFAVALRAVGEAIFGMDRDPHFDGAGC